MCGRTVSTLNHNEIRRACTYTNRHGRRMRPGRRNRGPRRGGGGGGGGGGGQKRGTTANQAPQTQAPSSNPSQGSEGVQRKYYPSFNISPTRTTPVLISSKHFGGKDASDPSLDTGDREIVPMTWGLVPSWHKGQAKEMAYKMNNCRGEGMLERASFKRPFEKGQRCVVLVDGFYEWKTDADKNKQPYFIYFAQEHPPVDLTIHSSEDLMEENPDLEVVEEPIEVSEDDPGWTGHKLLTMAGLFDCWNPPDGGEPLYTYSVITVESKDSLSWLHHRMPAILEGDDEIQTWLDFGTVDSNKKAASLVSARSCLAWHPVTKSVGNVRYKEPDCIKPIELGKPDKPKVESKSSQFMSSWLSKGSKTPEGKIKTEGGPAKKEEPSKKKTRASLMKWFVKKEKTEDEGMEDERKKRTGEGVTVKEEEPSPKKSRVS
nr:abasic site processing protein HMCES-like [Lytechinus pictus]